MVKVLKITSPLPPSVNHYTGIRIINKNGKNIPVVYETSEAKVYKRKFKHIIDEQVKLQGWDMEVNSTQHFYVDAVVFFDRIDRDASNYEKCLGDAITETKKIWNDDNVSMFRPARIYYDKNNPRIELTITPVEYIGIFDNQKHLSSFESKCKTCLRYKRNCKILKNAKEGRIQEEINNFKKDFECTKYKRIKGEK